VDVHSGAVQLFRADRCFFRDLEIINLDGLSETEALKAVSVSPSPSLRPPLQRL